MIIRKFTRNEDSVFKADDFDLDSELNDLTIQSEETLGDTTYYIGTRVRDNEEEEVRLEVAYEEDEEE